MANIGVVLSGGLAKGAYQVGLIKLLLEKRNANENYYICGSSVGALNGYAFASNQYDYLRLVWENINLKGVTDFFRMMKDKENLYHYINQLAVTKIEKGFHLYTICCEIPTFKEQCFNINRVCEQDLVEILLASITIPPVMEPVAIYNRKYIDGAFRKNIPIDFLKNKQLDYIIVIHFDTMPLALDDTYKNENIIEIQFNEVDHIISDSFNFETENINQMIQYGYEKSKMVLNEWFNKMEFETQTSRNKANKHILNINGDFILNRVNWVVEKIKSI